MANTITVSVVGDVANIRKGVDQVNSQLGGLGKAAKGVGSVVKGAFVFAAVKTGFDVVKNAIGETVRAGSDLQQSSGAMEAVFGKQAGAMSKIGDTAAKSFGLSKNEFNELSSVLGAGFKNQGIKDFAGETTKVVGLGADLAAQFGGSTKDAVAAIGSLMRGEADPIEKYGVSIKQTAIDAELAAKGQSKLTGAAKTSAEAQARLSLLFKQTSDASGAFGRESNTLAGVQQRNAAAVENLKAKFGTALLPVLTRVQNFIGTSVLPLLERFANYLTANLPGAIATVSAKFEQIKTALAPVMAALGAFITFMKENPETVKAFVVTLGILAAIIGVITLVQMAWNFAMTANPIGLIIVGIALLVAAIVYLVNNMDKVKAVFAKVWEGIKAVTSAVFGAVASFIKTVWNGIKAFFSNVWDAIKLIFTVQVNIIKTVVTKVWNTIKATNSAIWNGIKSVLSSVWNFIKNLVTNQVNAVKAVVTRVWNAIKTTNSTIWNGIKSTVTSAANGVKSAVTSAFNAAKTAVSNAWSKAKSLTSSAWSSIKTAVSNAVQSVRDKVASIREKVVSALGNVGSLLYNAGRNLIQGFINGISGSIGAVVNKAREIAQSAVSAAKSALGIFSPSRVFKQLGVYVGEGLANGVDSQTRNVVGSIRDMATDMTRAFSPDLVAVASVETPSVRALNASLSASQGAGVSQGGNTYNVTVQAGVGDPVAIGKTVLTYISAAEKSGARRAA